MSILEPSQPGDSPRPRLCPLELNIFMNSQTYVYVHQGSRPWSPNSLGHKSSFSSCKINNWTSDLTFISLVLIKRAKLISLAWPASTPSPVSLSCVGGTIDSHPLPSSEKFLRHRLL